MCICRYMQVCRFRPIWVFVELFCMFVCVCACVCMHSDILFCVVCNGSSLCITLTIVIPAKIYVHCTAQ